MSHASGGDRVLGVSGRLLRPWAVVAAAAAIALIGPPGPLVPPVAFGQAAGRARAVLHHAIVDGAAAPGTMVVASLRDPDAGGRLVADAVAEAGPSGAFRMALTDRSGVQPRMRAGQRLLVSFDGRPAADVLLPAMSAVADASADTVAGIAPPESPITVTLAGAPSATVRTMADASGRFRADFAGAFDVVPGAHGEVLAGRSDGHAVALAWAMPVASILLGEPDAWGIGPSGQPAAVTLYRGGFAVAQATTVAGGEADDMGSQWSMAVRDESGEGAPLLPEDHVVVDVGGSTLDLELSSVDVEPNVEADLVTGAAPPGAPARIEARRGSERASWDVQVGAGGEYAAGLAPDWDLRPGDTVTTTVSVVDGRARLAKRALAPGLVVSLDEASVHGYALPGATVGATLTGGSLRGAASGSAAPSGRYDLVLRAPGGGLARPVAGDELVVRFAGTAVSATVPVLTFEIDASADTVRGRATPGGVVSARVRRPYAPAGATADRTARPAADGAFEIAFGPSLDIVAGTRVSVSYLDERYNEFRRDRTLSGMLVQREGAQVAGYVAAGSAVTVTLTRAGTEAAGAMSLAGVDGAFDVVLVGSGSDAVADTGDLVTVRFGPPTGAPAGAPSELSHEVLPIWAQLDVAGRSVSGVAPPGARVGIAARGLGDRDRAAYYETIATAEGTFQRAIPGVAAETWLAAGSTFDVGTDDPMGFRTFVRLVAPYIAITLHRPDVTGVAAPSGDVFLAVESGPERASEARARTDTWGTYAAVLRASGGAAAPVRVGQRLRLTDRAGQSAVVDVPQLSVRLDRAAHVVDGTGPPGASLDVRLSATGRADAVVAATVGAGGRWAIADEDLPLGLPYDIGDARRATARLAVGNGHAVIADTDAPPEGVTPTATAIRSPTAPATPTGTSTPGIGRLLFLPWTARHARTTG